MEKCDPTREELFEEIRILRERLWEADQTIEAIRNGEIDALVIQKPDGEQLYTLTGADRGYRVLVESINEGALILSSDDSIYYCNRTLAKILDLPIHNIIGTKLDSYVTSEGPGQLQELITESRSLGTARGEFLVTRNDGTLLPVNLSLNHIGFEDFEGVCAIITDLSEQKQTQEELRRHRTEFELLVDERTADLAATNAALQQEIVQHEQAKEALRESQERFEALAKSSFEGIGFSDGGIIIDANAQLAQMLGHDLSEIIGKPVADLIAPEDREVVRQYMESGYEGRYENRLLRKDRSTLVVETQAKHFAYRGRVVRVSAMRDITERNQAEARLKEYEKTVEGLDDMIVVVDRDYRYLVANLAFLNYRDMKREQVVGHPVEEVLDKTVFENEIKSKLDECFQGNVVKYEMQYNYSKLGVRHLSISYFPIEGLTGVDRAVGVLRDITERKHAERALRQAMLDQRRQREFLECVITNAGSCIAVVQGPDLRYTLVNPAYQEISPGAPMVGRTYAEVFPEAAAAGAEEMVRRVLDTSDPWLLEDYPAPIPGKHDATWQGHVVRLPVGPGKVSSALVVIWDITKRKRMEKELHAALMKAEEGNRLLDTLMKNVPIGLGITGGPPDFRLKVASHYGLEMTGRSSETLIDHSTGYHQEAWDLRLSDGVIRPEAEQMPLYRASRFGETVRDFEMVLRTEDGRKIDLQVDAVPVLDDHGSIVGAINCWRDITERKQMEEALRDKEAALRGILDATKESIWLLSHDGFVLMANETAIQLHDKAVSEVIGKHYTEILRTELARSRLEHLRNVVESGRAVEFEDQRNGILFHHNLYPILDAEDRVTSVVCFSRDITERKRMEEELRQSHADLELKVQERTAELRINNRALMDYAAKLERLNRELEEFVFVASHDLQEPLRKIQTFGSMLMRDHKENLDEQAQALLLRITGSAKRISDSLHALLDYSRITSEPCRFELVDLKAVVQNVVSDFEDVINRIDGKIEIGNLPEVQADRTQIHHLLQNVIDNAIKYCKEVQAPHVKIYGEASGGTCSIFVEDNGIGFDERYLDLIFRPFQQLHGRGKYEGTGMGLALCRKIIERHDGSISARSVLGQGSTFIVRLPSIQRERV